MLLSSLALLALGVADRARRTPAPGADVLLIFQNLADVTPPPAFLTAPIANRGILACQFFGNPGDGTPLVEPLEDLANPLRFVLLDPKPRWSVVSTRAEMDTTTSRSPDSVLDHDDVLT